jgi:hypothetical protein
MSLDTLAKRKSAALLQLANQLRKGTRSPRFSDASITTQERERGRDRDDSNEQKQIDDGRPA